MTRNKLRVAHERATTKRSLRSSSKPDRAHLCLRAETSLIQDLCYSLRCLHGIPCRVDLAEVREVHRLLSPSCCGGNKGPTWRQALDWGGGRGAPVERPEEYTTNLPCGRTLRRTRQAAFLVVHWKYLVSVGAVAVFWGDDVGVCR